MRLRKQYLRVYLTLRLIAQDAVAEVSPECLGWFSGVLFFRISPLANHHDSKAIASPKAVVGIGVTISVFRMR
jgi:hypothetical protein